MKPLTLLRDKVDGFTETHLAKWDVLFVPIGLMMILGTGLGFWVTASDSAVKASIAAADATFMVTLFAIVSAWHARRQVKIALNSEQNAVAPLIRLALGPSGGGMLQVRCENVGKGAALNLQCWINHDALAHLQSRENRRTETALGAGDTYVASWAGEPEIPTPARNRDIYAQYEDIFRRMFESRLESVAIGPPKLYYGIVMDSSADKRLF